MTLAYECVGNIVKAYLFLDGQVIYHINIYPKSVIVISKAWAY